MDFSIFSSFLPQGLLTHFDIVDFKELGDLQTKNDCFYIYLDGSKLSTEEIKTLRQKIISDYKKGISFTSLANKYTMDNSKDGDLGWFDEGQMEKSFQDEILKHKKGELFTVDIPANNWFYIVLKTFADIEKTKITYILKEN